MDLFVNFDSARFAVNAFNQAVMIIMLYDDDSDTDCAQLLVFYSKVLMMSVVMFLLLGSVLVNIQNITYC